MLARQLADIAAANYPSCQVIFHPFMMTDGHGVEPDDQTATLMSQVEVILMVTTYSLTHTNARTKACQNGARVASMPLLEARMLSSDGPIAADPYEISAEVNHYARLLSAASLVRVRTAYGTDLRFSLEGRSGLVDDGLFLEPGKWGNLPTGEAYAVPLEGSGQGRLVVLAGWYFDLDQNMTFEFENGLVVSVEGGGQVGDEIRRALNLGSQDAQYLARRNLAELGIGCNPNARNPRNILEAEKIKGTVHIAIGDNLHMGGQVEADYHEDFVQPQVDLELDGHLVIEKASASKKHA